MSFITQGSTVISFASVDDVVQADQRIFDQNEGLTDDVVETALIRATQRILTMLKDSSWWKDQNAGVTPTPSLDATKIISRQADFTDLCIYIALANYILPSVADFDDQQTSERNKMDYYTSRANALFVELVESSDFYDMDGDGVIDSSEVVVSAALRRRVR